MKKFFTRILFKPSLTVLPFLILATGCHTPEDLREIGPQQEVIETEWDLGEEISAPTLQDFQNTGNPFQLEIEEGDDEENGGVSQTLNHTKTPFVMSRSTRRRRCSGC